jgi:hypothetical protein
MTNQEQRVPETLGHNPLKVSYAPNHPSIDFSIGTYQRERKTLSPWRLKGSASGKMQQRFIEIFFTSAM